MRHAALNDDAVLSDVMVTNDYHWKLIVLIVEKTFFFGQSKNVLRLTQLPLHASRSGEFNSYDNTDLDHNKILSSVYTHTTCITHDIGSHTPAVSRNML